MVNKQGEIDWQAIRSRAELFPEEAFQFVREGLVHTVKMIHGQGAMAKPAPSDPADESRHVSGQQMCMGLRDLAIERYGLLARTVLRRWGIRRTEEFGILVYAMIDRGELRSSGSDRLDDFQGVYDFDEAFETARLA